MPTVVMTVQKTELASGGGGIITCSRLNGPIQGTIALTFTDKNVVKSVDPGDSVTFTFNKV